MKFNFFIVAILLGLSFYPNISYSDWAEPVAKMVCDEKNNSFVIGFKHLDIQNSDYKNWKECVLGNGMKVNLKHKRLQVRAYGRGGADPDGLFYLIINGKDIFHGQRYYLKSRGFTYKQIKYQDGKLTECIRDLEYSKEEKKISCNDVSKRLTGNIKSDLEKIEKEKSDKRLYYKDKLSETCKNLEPNREEEDLFYNQYELLSSSPKFGQTLAKINIDINNDGKLDEVYRVGSYGDCKSCGNNYFSGSFLVAFTNDDNKDIDGFIKFITSDAADDINRKDSNDIFSKFGAKFISIGKAGDTSIRYIYNVPFIYQNKTHIYSFQENVERIPSKTIVKMNPAGSFDDVCLYP